MIRSTSPGRTAAFAMIAGSAVGMLAFASPASAWITNASDPFLTIRAQTGSSVGIVTIPLGDVFTGDFDGDSDVDQYFWFDFQRPIYEGVNANSGNVVATLVDIIILTGRNLVDVDGAGPSNEMEMRWGNDISFTVLAGAGGTSFEFLGPLLTFDNIQNARASASAGFVGTDQTRDFGTLLTPGLPSGYAYEALINGSPFQQYVDAPLGSLLPAANFSEAFNMDPLDDNDGDPTNGIFRNLNGSAFSSQVHVKFDLSSEDTAGFSSQFSVAPAPSGALLLGLSGLILGRRRR
ncbi:MAG: hypothetical protein ACK4WH_00160 [Phycisphaerales bacterium]